MSLCICQVPRTVPDASSSFTISIIPVQEHYSGAEERAQAMARSAAPSRFSIWADLCV